MAEGESGSGCGTAFVYLVGLALAYGVGLSYLGERREPWHYLAALPLGLIFAWIMWGGGTEVLVALFALPGVGIGIFVWLIEKKLNIWIIVAGSVFLVISGFCATAAARNRSHVVALNAFTSGILGLVMLVTGIVKQFL